MAQIEERKNGDRTVTYRVRWREHGERPTVTFNTGTLGARAGEIAQNFRSLVELNGETMPTREQLAVYGLEWILGVELSANAPAAPTAFVTVAQTVRRYLDWLAKQATPPSARTLYEYEGYLRRDVEPRALGVLDVATVEFEDIDAWQKELLTEVGPFGRKTLSNDSVRKIRQSLLAPAFTFACSVRSGRPPLRSRTSPVVDSELPQRDPHFMREILETPDEYALMIAEARAVDENWARMVAAVAATGLRFGEAVQAGPNAVNARRHTLHITQRFSAGSIEDGRKNGDAGTVPVPEWVTDRILLPAVSRGGPYLFVGPNGNRWAYATEWDRWDALRTRLAANGLHIHLTHHCLRKGYRTWLSSRKIEPVKIDEVMGHRTRGIQARYTALTVADRAEIRNVVTELLPDNVWPAA